MRPDRLATISGSFTGGGACSGWGHLSGARIICDDIWARAGEVQAQIRTSTAELSPAASRIVLVRRFFIAKGDHLAKNGPKQLVVFLSPCVPRDGAGSSASAKTHYVHAGALVCRTSASQVSRIARTCEL